ncbi:MAG: 30S ribosomal protein S17 [Oligoflexia bacterium]|nr:30S ribosomal protein S17 [Oligoflexia bacterium]
MAKAEKKVAAKSEPVRVRRHKERDGVVVSDKMTKTIVVAVTRQVKHGAYGKYIRRTKRYLAHDEKEQCDIGDLVRIVETKPLSRHKRWMVQKILTKAVQA